MTAIISSSRYKTLKGAQFNGTDEYAYIDNPSFKSDTQGCFIIWYRPTTVLSTITTGGVIGYGVKDGSNDSSWALCQRYNNSGTINATYRSQPIPDAFSRKTNAGTVSRAYGNHIFVAGTRVLWVINSNGSAWQHGINGSLITTAGWAGNANSGDWLGDISGSDHRLTFGSFFQSNAPTLYNDNISDEVMYMSRPITSGELTELYNSGTNKSVRSLSFRADIVSYWRMGDRDDGQIRDRIGSNHLTLVNMDNTNFVTP